MRLHLLIALPLSLLYVSPAPAQPPPPSPDVPVIVTTGEAVVRRPPDRAFVTISVETRAKSPRDAPRLNAEAMAEVQQRLAAARVPKDAIRTTGYDLQQEFDFNQGRRIPREFAARNPIEVHVDVVVRSGEIFVIAIQGSATFL